MYKDNGKKNHGLVAIWSKYGKWIEKLSESELDDSVFSYQFGWSELFMKAFWKFYGSHCYVLLQQKQLPPPSIVIIGLLPSIVISAQSVIYQWFNFTAVCKKNWIVLNNYFLFYLERTLEVPCLWSTSIRSWAFCGIWMPDMSIVLLLVVAMLLAVQRGCYPKDVCSYYLLLLLVQFSSIIHGGWWKSSSRFKTTTKKARSCHNVYLTTRWTRGRDVKWYLTTRWTSGRDMKWYLTHGIENSWSKRRWGLIVVCESALSHYVIGLVLPCDKKSQKPGRELFMKAFWKFHFIESIVTYMSSCTRNSCRRPLSSLDAGPTVRGCAYRGCSQVAREQPPVAHIG